MKQIFLLIFLCPLFSFAQKIPDFGIDKIHIVTPEAIIQAEILPVGSDPELHNDRFYFWYSSNSIHSTQGGYSGTLLNGNYKEFYTANTLKEEGNFKAGLKDGIWKLWNESGNLLSQYSWRKGTLSGNFILCDNKGYVVQSGKYKDGIIVVKDSVSFLQRIDFFKKKQVNNSRPKS